MQEKRKVFLGNVRLTQSRCVFQSQRGGLVIRTSCGHEVKFRFRGQLSFYFGFCQRWWRNCLSGAFLQIKVKPFMVFSSFLDSEILEKQASALVM